MEKTRTVVETIAEITQENIHKPHWALPSVLDHERQTIISIHQNICLQIDFMSFSKTLYICT